jgi:RimJ/RimL family protein N-acetyltransferase
LKDGQVESRSVRIDAGEVVLRPKLVEDAERDYAWRTDPELSALDATRPINLTFREYVRYYRDEIEFPSPWSVRFAIEDGEGRHIGNCMYYDINWDRREAELGIMIGDKSYWSRGYGTLAVKALVDHVFSSENLDRVYLHTLSDNFRAQRAFSKAGFQPVRRVRREGYEFINMELWREEWERQKQAAQHNAGTVAEA